MKDKMTPPERMHALMAGEQLDRVPCIPFIFGHTAVVSGLPIGKIYDDAETSFMCQLRAQEMYGYDGGPLYGYATAGAWEFGGEVDFPYKKYAGAPIVKKHPVNTEKEAQELKVPDDVTKAGAVAIALEFARLQNKYGMPVTVQVGSPLTWAGTIMGEDRMMAWMVKKPELVHLVLRKVTDFLLKVAEHWVEEFGAEKIMAFDGGPTEDNRLISPKFFETYAFPYVKELHEKACDMGIQTFFSHICGEQNKNLTYWSQIPYGKRSILSFGQEVPLKKVSEMFPEHIIAGNVDPSIIQEGTPEEILELCRKSIEDCKDHPGGYVLMAGCEVPPMAPPVNVFQMVKAVREYGQY